jgi:ribonuclease Z
MKLNGMTITGASSSGVGTCLTVQPYKVVLDIGFCTPEAIACQTVLVSHAHIDHMAGAVQHAASRSLASLSPSRFLCDPKTGAALEALFTLWKSIQGDFAHEILILSPGDAPIKLGHGLSVAAVPTYHRIASQGYILFETRGKLRPEFENLPGFQIGELRKKGVQVQDFTETPVLAFLGDTTPEALLDPLVQKAKTVITECTFVGDKITPEKARDRGHTHLAELRKYLSGLSCESLVLMHFSKRHGKDEIMEQVQTLATSYTLHPFFGDDFGQQE